MRMVRRGDKWNKNRELFVCIDGQDDLSDFKREHSMHEMIEVELV